MGFEIAKTAASLGAEVILITGPTQQKVQHTLIRVVPIISAEEMYREAHKYFQDVDIAILSAAVADYKPKTAASKKIKKTQTTFSIDLVKTKDILLSLGEVKKHQFLVGFALETDNEVENAILKLKRKHLNLIVLNSLNDQGAGFKTDTNKVTFIDEFETITEYQLKSKTEVAQDLLTEIIRQIDA